MVAQRVAVAGREIANGLHWVRTEIERSLARVRGHLEQYLESGTPDDRRPLLDAAEELAQVRGTARMVQCHGAATLADEMLQTLQALIAGAVDNPEPAFDALSGASLQLSDDIELLALGEPDRVIVLQPAINELRLARGQPLRTEAELFAMQLSATGLQIEPPPAGEEDVQSVARAELAGFQASFLDWFRERDVDAALRRMNRSAERIAGSAAAASLRRMWWVLALLSESLPGSSVDSLELKRLVGRAGMQLRQLAERGSVADADGDQAAAQLLYHLARCAQPSRRAVAAIAALRLTQILPDSATLEQVRRRLRMPNAGVLERVHQEVRRDLQQVKDAIDLVVRTRGRAGADLDVQRLRLQRLAETLGVLGLDGPRQVLTNQARAVAGLEATAPGWIDTATALLRVEHSLEEALFRAQGRYHAGDTRDYQEIADEVPHARDLREAVAALLRESLIDLAQVEAAVNAGIEQGHGGTAALNGDIARLMAEVAAGLQIIGRERGAALVRAVGAYASSGGLPAAVADPTAADRLADAITCVELYLEALRDGLPQPDSLLEQLDHCVARLPTRQLQATASAAAAPPSPTSAPAAMDEVDPEIRGVFIEEAAEVLAGLQQDLPRLRRAPQDREVLTAVRRAFHTLKGSGRMVGAARIAETAWALEQVFNRCLEGVLALRAPVLDLADEAAQLLSGLVSAFRDHRAEDPAVADLLARAQRLSSAADSGPNAEMYAVFREDARERLALIARWLETLGVGADGVDVEPEVVRAFHTLRGSAGVVQALPVQRLANAFEDYLNAVRLSGQRLPAAALALMSSTVRDLGGWIGSTGVAEVAADDLQRRVDQLAALQPAPPVAVAAPGAAPLIDAATRDRYTFEALTALQALEADVAAWRAESPRSDAEPARGAALGRRLDALATDAAHHGCTPLSEALAALAERLHGIAHAPSAALGSALDDVFEGLYQRLDAFREGEPVAEAAPLLDQIAGLPVAPPRPATAVPAAPVTPPREVDPELREIFFAEARELLADYAQALRRADALPGDAAPLSVLRRTLHTLKGSARMAGLDEVGQAAQDYERHAVDAEEAPDHAAAVLPLLHDAERDLRELLTDAGAQLDALPPPQLGELHAPGAAEPAERDGAEADAGVSAADVTAPPVPPDVEQRVGPDAEFEPEFEREPEPEPGTPLVPPPSERRGEARAPASDGQRPAAVDAELTAVFAAEAGELLETLDGALDAWRGGDERAAVQDIRRALHTLKGGARVAGLDRMGDVAHNMESRLELLLRSPEVDDLALQSLRLDLEQLHLLHDALSRGGQPQDTAAPAPAGSSAAWSAELFWRPADEQTQDPLLRREYARVPVDSLNDMLNQAGEVSIFRARLEQHNVGLRGQLNEMSQTIARVRGQLRMLDIETEAQIAARGLSAEAAGRDPDRYGQDFDPLEMDRYSRMQELSRALAEAVNDLASLYGLLDQGVSETDSLLQQQGRIGTQVQQGLMSTLMVPFSRQQTRLERVVRQTSLDSGKRVELHFEGLGAELDRNVLERITAPLEHLLRNAVVHGIELPDARRAAGKSEIGRIDVRLRREAEQLLIELVDDGRGLDFAAIRAKAIDSGRLRADAELSEDDLARFIFEPGFSTATTLTQDAGRGIGLDIVASAVRQLGGALELRSVPGGGARFLVRLPLTLAVSQALLVRVGVEQYAVPLPAIIGITRVPVSELAARLARDGAPLSYGGQDYPVRYLGDFVDVALPGEIESRSLVALLVRAGETLTGEERRVALVVDELLGNRELISKAIGPQLSAVPGVGGASILADGRVVLLLDVPALVSERSRRVRLAGGAPQPAAPRETIMVVDDSITMRRVAERLLERAGYRVVTARDGLDAIALLQTELPVTLLLDIEMPRADGFEVAAFVRNTERLAQVPIIMITSRSGEKHRERARSLGVDRYLIKPYQEDQLLHEIDTVRQAASG